MRKTALACLFGGVSAVTLFIGSQALAREAETAADDNGLEEVVVTAQRREESLQQVPVTVTAITASQMEKQGVTDTESLRAAVPGLNFSRSVNGGVPFLRGVGTVSATAGTEASVATYVDGVYLSSPYANIFSFNNIARIEVLKGPQGTLFGRNASGGVISIVTRDPSPEFSGRATLGYANYNTVESSLYVTGPLGPNLSADIAAYYLDQGDGWGRNLTTGAEVFYHSNYGVRSKLLWTPTPSTEVRFAVDYTRDFSDQGLNYHLFPTSVGLDGFVGNRGFYNTRNNVRDTAHTNQGGASLRIDQDVGFAKLVSITAYRNVHSYSSFDSDATPLQITQLYGDPREITYTQEFQILSPDEARISWIGGVFLYSTKTRFPTLFRGTSQNPTGALDRLNHFDSTSVAVFGQVTVPITDQTKITGGLRYTEDKKDADVTLTRPGPIVTSFLRASQKADKLTWRLAVDHQFSDDFMVYASLNRGFKSGLYNATNLAPVQPEVVDSIEAGFKSEFFEHRLRLNGSAFHYDFANIQLRRLTTAGQVLLNAAGAKIKGVELEFVAVPTNNFTLRGGISFVDGKYTSFPNAPINTPNPLGGNITTAGNASGNRTVQTPKITYNLTAEYRIPTSHGDYRVSVTDSYNDGYFFTPDNRITQPSFHVVNAAFTWEAPDGKLDVRFWAKNLLNKEYLSNAEEGAFGDYGSPAPPRTYGVTLGVRF